jgi:Fe/S biogenesis protein NfuA
MASSPSWRERAVAECCTEQDSQSGSVAAKVSIATMRGSLEHVSPLAPEATSRTSSEPIIAVTAEAIAQLVEMRDSEPDGAALGLRLEIISGEGEEFKYDLSFDEFTKAAFTDEVRTHTSPEGLALKVIIPAKAVDALQGATLDHTSSAGLVIRNPNKPRPPVVEGLVRDDELSAEIEALVISEVNPALAAHGGFVTFVGHDTEGTAYLTMGGGCHGCSMSKMTMLEGVQTMIVEQLPAIERVRDLTDHTSGDNPYYR